MFSKQPSKSKPSKAQPNKLSGEITLETFLTHPAFFGLETATPVQRAKCRIISGLPLGDLAEHPDVLEMCGGATLESGKRPHELLDISAIRIGKSLFAAAVVLWLSQTVKIPHNVRQSDFIRIFLVALNLKGTKVVLQHLLGPMLEKPALRSLLVDDPKEISVSSIERSGLRIRHPSGRIIEVACVPLDRAGGSVLSVFCAGVIVDEYPRMLGADDGVKNIDHVREGVLGRMLPQAVFLATGSPWQPYGPAYDAVIDHFGKPSKELVVLRTSAKSFINIAPGWTVTEDHDPVERLRLGSPLAYKTDYLAEFADGEQAVFPAVAIEDAYGHALPGVGDAEYGRPAIFADPSALRHDFWAAMVGGWVHPRARPDQLYEIEFLGEQITPGVGQVVSSNRGWIRILEDQYGRPIPRKDATTPRPWFEVYDLVSWDKNSGARGLDLVRAVGSLARKYRCTEFHWDGYEQLMLADLIRSENLRPLVHTWSGQGRKTEAVDLLRTLFVERRVHLPSHSQTSESCKHLKNELLRFRAKATPGGNFQYVVAGGAGHGDHASCLTLAMRADIDGYVDRSPVTRATTRHEVLDHVESESQFY
jgi:hypothetical protein